MTPAFKEYLYALRDSKIYSPFNTNYTLNGEDFHLNYIR